MDLNELPYQIGLTLIEGVGDINAKSLLAYCGSAKEVFKQKEAHLLKIPGIGTVLAKSILKSNGVLKRAEEEIKFITKYKITPVFYTDENYPKRLKYCSDSPVLLYFKGNADLNHNKIISIVGTRKPSEYGKQKTIEFVSELKDSGILILSGLAYGVDVMAHKAALQNNLNTIGVVAHGLDRIYPQTHDKIAKRMIGQGGLLTDFMSGTSPDAVNFPKRNRIVAGLCDALVVIESKRGGGSLITATIANSYNKDVFAFPGRAGDILAEGCNGLIKQNRAVLIENAADLLYAMQWVASEKPKTKPNQMALQINLSDDEKKVLNVIINKTNIHIDEICRQTEFTVSKTSTLLLQLEFGNLIKSLPGKMYTML
jgi:DNA processing protein